METMFLIVVVLLVSMLVASCIFMYYLLFTSISTLTTRMNVFENFNKDLRKELNSHDNI